MHKLTSRLSIALALLLWLAEPANAAAVTCGTPGFANFASDGDALRAAAKCIVQNTGCQDANLPAGATSDSDTSRVIATYGDISQWCTGEVQDFSNVFSGMSVRRMKRRS
jgi:hypothetical protein